MESKESDRFWTESRIVAEAGEIARVRAEIEAERRKIREREREMEDRERLMRDSCRHPSRRLAFTPWARTAYYECDVCRAILGPIPGQED